MNLSSRISSSGSLVQIVGRKWPVIEPDDWLGSIFGHLELSERLLTNVVLNVEAEGEGVLALMRFKRTCARKTRLHKSRIGGSAARNFGSPILGIEGIDAECTGSLAESGKSGEYCASAADMAWWLNGDFASGLYQSYRSAERVGTRDVSTMHFD